MLHALHGRVEDVAQKLKTRLPETLEAGELLVSKGRGLYEAFAPVINDDGFHLFNDDDDFVMVG